MKLKKIMALTLVTAMTAGMSLTGCGGSDGKDSGSDGGSSSDSGDLSRSNGYPREPAKTVGKELQSLSSKLTKKKPVFISTQNSIHLTICSK